MNKNLKRGFTLIELVAVVGILGITATLILPQATSYIEKSQKATCDEQREILEREMVTRNVSDTNTYSINAEGYRKLLSESHNGSIQCPAGGTYTWYALSDTSGYIECSVHGHDAPISGTAAEDDGDTGNITSVVVTDTSGNKYTITASYSDWNAVEAKLSSYSGWTIPAGTTFSDGTGVYLFAGYPTNYADSAKNWTWSTLFTKANMIKLSSSSTVLDSTNIITSAGAHWSKSPYPNRGRLYAKSGILYFAAENCGQYDTPLNASGKWPTVK